MLSIPTLSQLYSQIVSDIESEMQITIPIIGPSVIRTIAAVQAAKIWIAYKFIGSIQKNIFIDTADPEAAGGTLERFGRIKLGRNPFPAQAGQYEIEVTGTVGGSIPAGTTYKSDDDSLNPGILYVLDSAHTMVTSADTITVRCLTAGESGALSIGDTLTATAPIALVNKLATVVTEVVVPAAAETTEEYRTKGLNSYRLEPQGGAATDYRLWAQDAQGVANSYPYVISGESGGIRLYVEASTDTSTDGKGTPSAGLLAAVEVVVNTNPDTTITASERGRRPMQDEVDYQPITPLDIEIQVTGFVGLTTAVQDSILSALTESINMVRPFISGIDVLSNRNDILDKNKIIGVILSVKPGAIFESIELTVDGNVVDTYTFTEGYIPYLDSVSYVD